MTEEFAFQRRFIQGGAIELYEWAIFPATQLMDGPGRKFLASIAFAST
jgi:hypothetical protein